MNDSKKPQVELFPISDINIEPRIRNGTDPTVLAHIDDLCASIERFGGYPDGLLQPPILDETNTLQDGWCRYSACVKLGWTHMPVYRRTKLSDADYREIELETNFRRLGFTWQQTIQAVVEIHQKRRSLAVLKGDRWTQAMTGELLGGYSDSYVSNCLDVAPLLTTSPDLFKECDSITDAVRILLRQKEDRAVAEAAKRTSLRPNAAPVFITEAGNGKSTAIRIASELLATTTDEQVVDLSSTLFHAKSVWDGKGDRDNYLLKSWPAECVDHIISDPPYAIDVAMLQQASTALIDVSRVDSTHEVDANVSMYEQMFADFWRILKPAGFCVFCCDIMNWQFMYDLASLAGFRVQRWPIVWHKTGKCKNQMAHQNTTKNVEFCIVCSKDCATLPRPVLTSVITCANDDEEKLSNTFAKPFDFWRPLIEMFTTPGQTILEPFAGEGSAVVAGLRLNRRMVAIEMDVHYNYMVEKVKAHWQKVFAKVRFV